MTSNGYRADWAGIRRHGKVPAAEAEFARLVLHEVREAFVAAGRPMGHDQYGAEMEKNYPLMRDGIYQAFQVYIDELDGTGRGMHVTAATYETADDSSRAGA